MQESKSMVRPPMTNAEYEQIHAVEERVCGHHSPVTSEAQQRVDSLISRVTRLDSALGEELSQAFLAWDDALTAERSDILWHVWAAARRQGFRTALNVYSILQRDPAAVGVAPQDVVGTVVQLLNDDAFCDSFITRILDHPDEGSPGAPTSDAGRSE